MYRFRLVAEEFVFWKVNHAQDVFLVRVKCLEIFHLDCGINFLQFWAQVTALIHLQRWLLFKLFCFCFLFFSRSNCNF
jgi:hypothetical protein